jgi:2-polyprenyl-3-methyl-5-hydroxy-6-metoxy-1,4-benzoquinol methylase
MLTEAMSNEDHIYRELAEAFVRGSLGSEAGQLDGAALLPLGRARGLKMHRFKRTQELPRVRAVLGALRGIGPRSLIDIGTGRGVFLWPLLDAFPHLAVTAVEPDAGRRRYLEAVRAGGIDRLDVAAIDATALPHADRAFDVSTVLEVLEHQHDPLPLARQAMRVADRFVIASVPSKPDDNPEHVQLFTARSLTALLVAAGAASVTTEHVLGHIVAVARRGST